MSESLFINAITNRNLDEMNNFIRRDRDVNGFKHMRMTPLIYALHSCEPSESGNIDEIISCLIDKGAEVNAMYEDSGMTATMLAIDKNRSDEIVLKFIEAGTDVRVTCRDGKTTLDHALEKNCGKTVIRVLIYKGSDVRNHHSEKTPLYYAVMIIKDPEIIEMILIKGGVINLNEFETPLLALCCQERCKIGDICRFKRVTDILIRRGVDINERGITGDTIIHQATCNYVFSLAQRYGVSIDAANYLGISPLFDAFKHHDVDKLNDLLSIGADPNCRDYLGNTPLHGNRMFLNETCVNKLLYHGADVFAKNYLGETTLIMNLRDIFEIVLRQNLLTRFRDYYKEKILIVQNILLYENENELDDVTGRTENRGYNSIITDIDLLKVEISKMRKILLKENLSVYQFCILKRFYRNRYISIKIDQYLIDHDTIKNHFIYYKQIIFMRLKDNSKKNFKHNLLESLNSISVSPASTASGNKLASEIDHKCLYNVAKYLNYRQLYALISISFNQ